MTWPVFAVLAFALLAYLIIAGMTILLFHDLNDELEDR